MRRLAMARVASRLGPNEFRDILEHELGLTRGHTVLVHASFGRLKASFTPEVAVQVLKDIIGREGNILMPYYPGNSDEWLESGQVFDPRTTPTTTGVLAQVFSQSPGVAVSLHPTKAVAGWGKDRDFLLNQHHVSKTPYDEHSPYARLLLLQNSCVVGLGTSKMSFFHCCEDSVDAYAERLYSTAPVRGYCRDADGRIVEVMTRVHRPEVMHSKRSSMEFLKATACLDYKIATCRGRMFYAANAPRVYRHVQKELQRLVAHRPLDVRHV